MDVETTLLSYRGIKNLHIGAVAVSLCLFALRGVWMMRGSARLQQRWVKIVPHVVDTLLLASAVWLAIQLRVMPLRDAWLTAKVAGLIAYVVLGSIALKRGRTPAIRIAAFAGALLVFAYIVAVAWTKQPTVIG
jgi:uncharacterized membrane protein SirB2